MGVSLAIDPVPERKVVKNRVHLDLKPSGTVGTELAGLEQPGAQVPQVFPGSHVVMQDPAGNEFCIVESKTLVEAGGHLTATLLETGMVG